MYIQRRKPNTAIIGTCIGITTILSAIAGTSIWFPDTLPYIDIDLTPLTNPYKGSLNNLFSGLKSPGTLSICAAEGNCIINIADDKKVHVKYSSQYYGHEDPGNSVYNRGFCSDQGRGGVIRNKEGKVLLKKTAEKADLGCLQRTTSRISRLVAKMRDAGLDPEKHVEAFVNALDLWNQASPRVSDNFPKAYKKALDQGMTGTKAVLWARVEAFRRKNGELEAGKITKRVRLGLFRVCIEQPYYIEKLANYVVMSEKWRWVCISLDQSRRANAIADTLSKTLQ